MNLPDYALDDDGLLARCERHEGTSSGPGGQHANRTRSAVRLIHNSGLQAQCQDHRDRERNLRQALWRLRLRLALKQRGVSDPAWFRALRRGRRIVARSGARDFHLGVAVALDAVQEAAGRIGEAAGALGVSSSQLQAFLADEKEVWQAVQDLRAVHGHAPLRRG